MMAKQSTAKITLTLNENGATYAAMLSTIMGDVVQYYSSEKVTPDLAKNPCTLMLHCTSSLNPTGETIPLNIQLYLDDVLVTIPAGQSENIACGPNNIIPAGMFKISGGPETSGTGSNWQISIKKDFISPSSSTLQDKILKVVGQVEDGTMISATIPLQAKPLTESGLDVHIIGEGTNPFVVDQNKSGSSCKLKALIVLGGEPLTTIDPTKYTFRWEKMKAGGWSVIAGATGQELTVTADDVDSYAEYRLVVTKDGKEYSDTQSVMDVGDPYVVGIDVAEPGGASTDLTYSSTVSSTKKLTATVSKRDGSSVDITKFAFFWTLMRTDGSIINSLYDATTHLNGQGVADMTLNTRSISIPSEYLATNAVKQLIVILVAEY